MPNPAVVQDVADRWRPLTPDEQYQVSVFLEDAWWLLTSRLPTLDANLTAGTVTTGNVVRVLASMVVRVMRNPEGWEDEAIDDWRGRRNVLTASGVLHATADELASLSPGGYRSVRSVRLVKYGDA